MNLFDLNHKFINYSIGGPRYYYCSKCNLIIFAIILNDFSNQSIRISTVN